MGSEQGILPGCGSAVGSEAEGESKVKPEARGGKPRYEVINRASIARQSRNQKLKPGIYHRGAGREKKSPRPHSSSI